ncbi:carbohydrate ABC transporter permease [Paenibacillus sp. GCM10023252]|uniref:carbohydrate ABC transporter permease n=1 Tax=Paenibacillus sp. GCM10023252 TaxID=3252649 RepID=UPI003623ACAF
MNSTQHNATYNSNKPRILRRKNIVKTIRYTAAYILLLLVALTMVGPFLWLLSTAMKSGGENIFAYPPKLLPQDPTLANFGKVMDAFPFWRYLWNSTVVSVLTVASNLLFCSLAAFPLARMAFRGKQVIFILILSTMMIPFQLLMIPIYLLALDMGLQNTHLGLVLPHAATAFGIFLMRQAYLSIPYALDESAYMDGATSLQVWWKILMPLVRPSIVTLAIFTFMMAWGDFLWPLILASDTSMYTLPLGVNALAGSFSSDWRMIAAGSIISILPIVVLFILLQRYFISGATNGAIKG